MLCIGHRGAAGLEPENTLRGIRRALELGASGIEIDIHATGGELLVIHDSTLDRTTSGRGKLRRRSLDYIRALDAGRGERVPLLREVIDLVDRRALLNIELKGRATAAPVLALLHEYLGRGWQPGDFLISSFRRRELRALRGSGFPLGLLFAGAARRFRPLARTLDAWSINIPLAHASARIAGRAHAEGRKVLVYTVNTRRDMDRMAALGVDGIFTDFPDRWALRKS